MSEKEAPNSPKAQEKRKREPDAAAGSGEECCDSGSSCDMNLPAEMQSLLNSLKGSSKPCDIDMLKFPQEMRNIINTLKDLKGTLGLPPKAQEEKPKADGGCCDSGSSGLSGMNLNDPEQIEKLVNSIRAEIASTNFASEPPKSQDPQEGKPKAGFQFGCCDSGFCGLSGMNVDDPEEMEKLMKSIKFAAENGPQVAPADDGKHQRIFCFGSFDLFHGGHIALLRKAKGLSPNSKLVVGVFSDDTVLGKLRTPVFDQNQRAEILKGCKFVDEVIADAPASGSINKTYLDSINCDFILKARLGWKGDDSFVLMIGSKDNAHPERMCRKDDRFDSDEILLRMLSMEPKDENNNTTSGINWEKCMKQLKLEAPLIPLSTKDVLRIKSEWEGNDVLKSTDKVIYVAGSFDVFNQSHVKLLEKARSMGDYLLVGLHSDETIRSYSPEGSNFPILKSHERLIPLLACKYVSDVMIDAPLKISKDFFKEYPSALVLDFGGAAPISEDEITKLNFIYSHLSLTTAEENPISEDDLKLIKNDPFEIPKKEGRYEKLSLTPEEMEFLDPAVILRRIHSNAALHNDYFQYLMVD